MAGDARGMESRMMKKLNDDAINLAYEIVHSKSDKEIVFGDGSDRQGFLYISWLNGFDAHLTIYSEPQTTPATRYYSAETSWSQEDYTLTAVKFSAVTKWLDDFGFQL